ncbi:hypothetical protein SAMN06893096_103393 [Geodermatophilus pulveris]|uniref:PknH-like extracellular domain-containing protein n=1 Tax=Geodermatophilus pulveris TaxID=1564159 RepID=A0A239DWC1_9ACTN|nr:hypothetical protein [Geodermatophilus pulveris]SNS36539.1 hypothetical protein SAMN06893096_103393 [Geodermatophilus pulveris]
MRTAGAWVLVAALGLTSCTAAVEGTASPGGPPDLAAALSVPVPGARPVRPPPPPALLCTTAPGTPAPRVDPALGEPVAAGHAAEDATVHVYAWATSVPMVAEAVLGQARAEAPDCASAAPGPPARSVADWSGSGWTGVTIRSGSAGETRLVHAGEVVVLVVATGSEPSVVDDLLAAVGQRLG